MKKNNFEQNLILEELNQIIDEELGINQEMDEVAGNAAKSIISNLNGKTAVEKDGVPRKEHSEATFLHGKIIKFHVTQYFFNSNADYENFVKTKFIPRGWMGEMKWVCIPIIMINNNPLEDIYDFVYHEVEHAFQEIISGKPISGGERYLNACYNLKSKHEPKRIVAELVYIMDKGEQNAFTNGMYGSLKHNTNILTLDDEFKNSEAYSWLVKLGNNIKFVETHPECSEYIKHYGYSPTEFLNLAKKAKKEFMKNLSRALYKLKKDAFEGYRPHITTNYLKSIEGLNEGYMFHIS